MTKHVIIYSHGFGVRKDGRGLFTDIAAVLPRYEHVMFDYGTFDKAANTLTIPSLHEQAEKLRRVIANVRASNPGAVIDLICHSQGCVVTSLLKPKGIRKFIFIGAPAELSKQDMLRLFSQRPGSDIDVDGISRLARADFSTTVILPDYWKSLDGISPIELYNQVAKATPLTLVNATQDEIIGSLDFAGLASEVEIVEIATGHNFEGDGRQQMLDAVIEIEEYVSSEA